MAKNLDTEYRAYYLEVVKKYTTEELETGLKVMQRKGTPMHDAFTAELATR